MKSISQSLLPSYRERRRVVGVALWLLRQVHNAEQEDALRHSGRLDDFDFGSDRNAYLAIEEACINSEYACGSLESVIEDLKYIY
jgi:hypothetical protein